MTNPYAPFWIWDVQRIQANTKSEARAFLKARLNYRKRLPKGWKLVKEPK